MTDAIRRCAQCGRLAKASARFCSACGAALLLTVGMRLGQDGRYQIEALLGKGGFGQAYKALDQKLNQQCVIKRLVVSQYDQATQQRIRVSFAHEVQLLVELNEPGHANIPSIYDYLPESECLVMKYIAGRSLGKLMGGRIKPLDEAFALHYVREVCAALVYMHRHAAEPILHCDIKPDNILLGENDHVWLIDFGLAHMHATTLNTSSAVPLTGAGTPGYAPPEQWLGEPIPRSDVYALAATLYTLLTNLPPVVAIQRGRSGSLPPVRQFNPKVREEIEQMIQQAMDANADARPTAHVFLHALDQLQYPDIPLPIEPLRAPDVPLFIGRTADMARFTEQLQTRHFAVIIGWAGVGKTSIAAMVARSVAVAEDIFWHRFHAQEGMESVIWALAGFLAWHGHHTLWRQLHSRRQEHVAPPLEVLGAMLVQALAAHPYMVCFDDWHHVDADPQIHQFIAHLSAAARTGSVRLIITARTTPDLPALEQEPTSVLAGLDARDAATLLARHEIALPDALAHTMIRATEGNPQLLILAISALRHTTQPMRLIADLARAEHIEQYVLNEVDRGLTATEQDVLGALAALLDYGGTRDAIEALLDGTSAARALISLQRRNLVSVREGRLEREYGLHAMVQGFYYATRSRTQRSTRHCRAGEFYEQVEVDPLKAARHYILGGEPARAAHLATSDLPALINRGQARALATLLAQLPPERLDPSLRTEVATAHGEIAALLGDYPLARAQLMAAVADGTNMRATGAGGEQSTPPAEIEAQARRYRLLGLVDERTAQYDTGIAACHAGLDLVRTLGIPNLEAARLYAQVAEIQMRVGEADAVADACRAGLDTLPPEPAAPRERALLLQRLATTDGERGLYVKALDELQRSLALARQSSDLGLTALVLNNVGVCHDAIGARDAARQAFEESLQIKDQIGDTVGRIKTLNNLGMLYLSEGERDIALQYFEECRDLSEQLHLPRDLALAQQSIGQWHFDQGHLALAVESLTYAQQLHAQVDNGDDAALCLYVLGDIALLQGDPYTAAAYGTRALELARAAESDTNEASALRVLGEAALTQGHIAEAADYLDQSRTIQATIGDDYDQAFLLAARARLAQAQDDPAQARALTEQSLALAREQHISVLVQALESLLTDL